MLFGTNSDGRLDIHVNSELQRSLSRLTIASETHASECQTVPQGLTKPNFNIKLNIVVQVVGSRGDVQPFVALGCELQSHGHRVRIATHPNFEDFVHEAGLEFYSIGGDPAELMAYMVKNPGLIPSMKSLRAGEIKSKRDMVAAMLDGSWASCYMPDLGTGAPFVADAIIANPPSFAHVHCAEALGVPLHMMFTMPWSSTRAFPHPLVNVLHSDTTEPTVANYISYSMVNILTWQGLGDLVNDWRRKTLGLDEVTATAGPGLLQNLNIPFTYCWSPALISKPQDWKANIDVCGFFFRKIPQYKPEHDLRHFLHSDLAKSTIYIGFGSIVIDDPAEMTKIIVQGVLASGVRAIVSRGWSKLGGIEHPDIFYLGDCPHEWLFQHVVAVVHHGGAGTTSCGLLNGKPTTIIPFFGDQQFWGKMVAAAGAGPMPIPHKLLSAEMLAEAITFCLKPEVQSAAKRIADRMKAENGVKSAVESFHAHLPVDKIRCDVLPDQAAVWTIKVNDKQMHLSNLAVCIMTRQNFISESNLRLYQSKPLIIDHQRLDPVSAVLSSSLTTMKYMGQAFTGIITEPYNIYSTHRSQTISRGRSDLLSAQTPLPTTVAVSGSPSLSRTSTDSSSNSSSGHLGSRRSHFVTAAVMARASGRSAGRVFTSLAQGILVDIPLAATEGLNAISATYSVERPSSHSKHVTGWKSGGAVAGYQFLKGMREGLTDIIVLPYRGKKVHGALGVTAGLGEGCVSLTAKTGAAVLGLVAYSGQGVRRSLQVVLRTRMRKLIEHARSQEGAWLEKRIEEGEDGVYLRQICGAVCDKWSRR